MGKGLLVCHLSPPFIEALTNELNRSILRVNVNLRIAGSYKTDCGRTWRGERGEEWSTAQGLESILISIQSLMSSNPYENEPGFETANDEGDKKNQKDYVTKVRRKPLAHLPY